MSLALQEIIKIATQQLENAGVADAEHDARELYMYQAGLNRTGLMMHWQDVLQDNQCEAYFSLIERRAEREPLQYITGTQAFMNCSFKVNDKVLIPRQDTESVVEEAVKIIEKKPGDVLDLCTGSGAIGISIKSMVPKTKVICADIDTDALRVAEENAGLNGIRGIKFVESDMFGAFKGRFGSRKFDYIVSNPPYIERRVLDTLEPEVKDHEPMKALDGGEDGLDFYRIIAEEAQNHLKKGGTLILEIGYDQADSLKELLSSAGFCDIYVKKDYAGNDRTVVASAAQK